MQRNIPIIFFLTFILSAPNFRLQAQPISINNYIGIWEGKLFIYNAGEIKDSIESSITIAAHNEPNTWIWKTEYFGAKDTIVKDYLLKAINLQKQHYVIDEQDSILLDSYLHGNKLFSTFTVKENIMTSSYQLGKKEIIFEVSMAQPSTNKHKNVESYTIISYQKAIYSRKRNK